ncbi:MAG TPA: alpha/beta fold hydrolase [Polyangiales bacterium]|nr:alpha/beta fold hydrolase [Polyangiales bacterium]
MTLEPVHASEHDWKRARSGHLKLVDRELAYLEWGAGAAGDADGQRTVVLVHGILSHALVWQPVAELLVERGFRVVAPDLRGHGLSMHNPIGDGYGLISFARDLESLLQALHIERFVLAGHSLGSLVVLFYTACIGTGVEGLALLETLLLGASEPVDLQALLARDLAHMRATHQHQTVPTLQAAANMLRMSHRGLSPELALQLCVRGMLETPGGWVWRWDPILRTRVGLRFPGTRAQYLKILRQIDVPVQLLFGRESQFNRSEEKQALTSAFGAVRVASIAGGHNLHIENPGPVADALLSLVHGVTNCQIGHNRTLDHQWSHT